MLVCVYIYIVCICVPTRRVGAVTSRIHGYILTTSRAFLERAAQVCLCVYMYIYIYINSMYLYTHKARRRCNVTNSWLYTHDLHIHTCTYTCILTHTHIYCCLVHKHTMNLRINTVLGLLHTPNPTYSQTDDVHRHGSRLSIRTLHDCMRAHTRTRTHAYIHRQGSHFSIRTACMTICTHTHTRTHTDKVHK
jgi:hypothetical protein